MSAERSGFQPIVDLKEAHRQVRVSAMLIGGLAVAISAAVLSMPSLEAPAYDTLSVSPRTLHAGQTAPVSARS